VQRFAGQPFVLLGVNADESRERLLEIQETSHLTWESWWDGPGGPIGETWGIEGYPTFVLIDVQGVVRWRQAGVPRSGVLERKIQELLDEARTRPAS
jgi:hypothetical protein